MLASFSCQHQFCSHPCRARAAPVCVPARHLPLAVPRIGAPCLHCPHVHALSLAHSGCGMAWHHEHVRMCGRAMPVAAQAAARGRGRGGVPVCRRPHQNCKPARYIQYESDTHQCHNQATYQHKQWHAAGAHYMRAHRQYSRCTAPASARSTHTHTHAHTHTHTSIHTCTRHTATHAVTSRRHSPRSVRTALHCTALHAAVQAQAHTYRGSRPAVPLPAALPVCQRPPATTKGHRWNMEHGSSTGKDRQAPQPPQLGWVERGA